MYVILWHTSLLHFGSIIHKYCHYVAGLVGIGLSRLFVASGLERAEVGEDSRLANNMGLFLQKTNIIRDYLEDVRQGREFWPTKVIQQSDVEKTNECTHIYTACMIEMKCNDWLNLVNHFVGMESVCFAVEGLPVCQQQR